MKERFPHAEARSVAVFLRDVLAPFCHRIEIAGSIRRQLPYVGDVELLLIPKKALPAQGFFDAIISGEPVEMCDLAADAIDGLVESGVLKQRRNVNGSVIWGDRNKLAVHAASGIPVDLFFTSKQGWFMSLVIRTGGKETNITLATAALRHGLRLHPYEGGYTNRSTGSMILCRSEAEVFTRVGLPHVPPHKRK